MHDFGSGGSGEGGSHDVQVIETTPWNKTERGREHKFSPAGERPGDGVG